MTIKEDKWLLIFNWLKEHNKTVSTMESCTGGFVANMITNYKGASDMFSLGLVSYSNQVKINFGVPASIIEKYTVYSKETAASMARTVCNLASSTYGIGITGELSKENGVTYICIYDSVNDKEYYKTISTNLDKRSDEKVAVTNIVIDLLFEIINFEKEV